MYGPTWFFPHFTIHIFFTICEALFRTMASIIPPMSIFPCHRMGNIHLSFLLLRYCHSDHLLRHLLFSKHFPKMFLYAFLKIVFVRNCNDIFSFNFDFASTQIFLPRQVTDHLISYQRSLHDPIITEFKLLISSVWYMHLRLCGQPHSATNHTALIHFIPFQWAVFIKSAPLSPSTW